MSTKTAIQKECPICGVYFETTKSNKIYCDKCSLNSDSAKKILARNMARSKRTYRMPEIIEHVCAECGKVYVTASYLEFKDRELNRTSAVFCSKKCLHAYKRKNHHCLYCGGVLKNSTFYNPDNPASAFCDEKCHSAYMFKSAKEKHETDTCPECGREFINYGHKKVYCNRACYDKALREGHVKKPVRIKASSVTVNATCKICGKHQTIIVPSSEVEKTIASFTCCEEHKQRFIKVQERKLALKRAAQRKEQEMQKQKDTLKKQKEAPVAICSTCKTPYKSCERMSSNFRVIPQGAHYNDKGILVTCPKYTGVDAI